jgi:hypothetical protein
MTFVGKSSKFSGNYLVNCRLTLRITYRLAIPADAAYGGALTGR